MPLEFEWDDDKASANLEKHGVDFVDAAQIFAGVTFEVADTRRAYGEPRTRAIGAHDEEVYVVVYTPRGDRLRLISAWKAGHNDRKQYHAHLAARSGRA
jgi:uncharacterized DUF497 family protein